MRTSTNASEQEANGKLLYSVEEAARLLSMSRAKLYRLIDLCELGSVRIGRSRRISRNQLETFIRSLEQAAPTGDGFLQATLVAKGRPKG